MCNFANYKSTASAGLSLLLLIVLSGCEPNYLAEHVKDEEPDTFGLLEIGHASFQATDVDRDNRQLTIDVWYPVDDEDVGDGKLSQYSLLGPIGLPASIALANKPVSSQGPYQLVIFSHGYTGINTQSTPLMETIASHGFIVAAVEHAGNSQRDSSDSFDEAASKRVPDVSFVIDLFNEKTLDSADIFYDRIDMDGVAVVGHSFGGMTAIGTAAGWAGAEADPRVTAIVAMSAVIRAELQNDLREGPNAGFTDQQLRAIDVPAMLIGGTEDQSVDIENNAIAFSAMSAPVYKADIIGANHTHFANVCDIGNFLKRLGIHEGLWPLIGAEQLGEPYQRTCSDGVLPIQEAVRLINLLVVSFLNTHMRGVDYSGYLTSEYMDLYEENATLIYK